MIITVAAASRQGTSADNADAVAVERLPTGAVAVAVVDGIGHGEDVIKCSWLLAEVAARAGARRGVLAGLMSAGTLITQPGPEVVAPDAVGVLAVVSTDADDDVAIGWVGDCRAYGWDGFELRQFTTDATVGEQLRANGVALELAADHDNWVRATFGRAVIASIFQAWIPDDLVILCSDGVPGHIPHAALVELVRQHGDDPQALADAIVAAAQEDEEGYRDDVTVVVICREEVVGHG